MRKKAKSIDRSSWKIQKDFFCNIFLAFFVFHAIIELIISSFIKIKKAHGALFVFYGLKRGKGSMINGLLLFLIVFSLSAQNVLKKAFGLRVENVVFSFSAITVFFALLFFFVTSGGNLHFSFDLFLYSFAFAAAYCTTVIFSLKALLCGSMALTSLICQYSLLIPTFYGIVFLSESAGVFLYVGLALLMLSLLLTNLTGKKEKKPSLRWVIFILIAFFTNGLCSTFQKMQQIAFDGRYKSEFMIMALAMALVFLIAASFMKEKEKIKLVLKKGAIFGAFCGIYRVSRCF